MRERFYVGFLMALVFLIFGFVIFHKNISSSEDNLGLVSDSLKGESVGSEKIYHIFFHSLVVYPKLAFRDDSRGKLFKNYMVTRDEFEKILGALYENNFVLIDISKIYEKGADGKIKRKNFEIPEGKKPLILSLDDLSYYKSMSGRGFAKKLVLDDEGEVRTEITTPEGVDQITKDGDVIPILEDFIKKHPDFSFEGARGIIALTGSEGIFGYKTEKGSPNRESETQGAEKIVSKLKEYGWKFASHSYSHGDKFFTSRISLDELKRDTAEWKSEVEPIIGKTNIFIGPFGQIFKESDPRRKYLIGEGFEVLCGVDAHQPLKYYSDHITIGRANIDGIRLFKTPHLLSQFFEPKKVINPVISPFRTP